ELVLRRFHGNQSDVKSSKHQHPSSRETPRTKLQDVRTKHLGVRTRVRPGTQPGGAEYLWQPVRANGKAPVGEGAAERIGPRATDQRRPSQQDGIGGGELGRQRRERNKVEVADGLDRGLAAGSAAEADVGSTSADNRWDIDRGGCGVGTARDWIIYLDGKSCA